MTASTGVTVPYLSRRSILAAMTGAAAVGPAAFPAARAVAADTFASNTALYADPSVDEGTDYARRHRRHASYDDSETGAATYPTTVILALHGGGIEPGTSELCLAIAGYHPADQSPVPAGGPVYDYWMFEGIRSTNNSELHVTSTHCDDPVGWSLARGARRAVSLHGCSPAQAGVPAGTSAVLVGGLDTDLRTALLAAYAGVGIVAIDAVGNPDLGGTDPQNIVNRTMTGAGAQLELTTPMRTAMFTTNTRPQRRHTTTSAFWRFVEATRAALAN
ncbi:poly-gamma-glutamate hydrolase family protein [Virgisporangium ochraceum]|uniref:poly-gamma-glutamate hydrolase family protein n=1 Tax=Virgisporangium ochraceum TaxID=65505 RepID=UPI00194332BE|nr:poly-gamma-glutamate hydrolase family protein [Virgisporangium ochraceum]